MTANLNVNTVDLPNVPDDATRSWSWNEFLFAAGLADSSELPAKQRGDVGLRRPFEARRRTRSRKSRAAILAASSFRVIADARITTGGACRDDKRSKRVLAAEAAG